MPSHKSCTWPIETYKAIKICIVFNAKFDERLFLTTNIPEQLVTLLDDYLSNNTANRRMDSILSLT